MSFPDQTKRIIGGIGTVVVVGVAAYDLTAVKKRGYALTVRTQGTVISAITVQDEGGAARAYSPTWLGIALNQGDYFVRDSPIATITLTAATDSIAIHCDLPY